MSPADALPKSSRDGGGACVNAAWPGFACLIVSVGFFFLINKMNHFVVFVVIFLSFFFFKKRLKNILIQKKILNIF